MKSILRIYTDRRYLPTGAPHAEMLYPFWGMVEEKAFWKYDRRFERYLMIGPTIFEITAVPEEADVHFLPADWGYYLLSKETAKAKEMSALAKELGKPLIVCFRDDRECKTELHNTFEFCTNLERTTRRKNQHALVAWTGDFVEAYLQGKLPVREKNGKPVVSFCGQTLWNKNIFSKSKWLLGRIRHPIQTRKFRFLSMREKVLKALESSSHVRTSFVRRDGWYGGNERVEGGDNHEIIRKIRRDYLNNLINCDYVASVRGAGNYSFRFYESLACGRIPLFIDTDCVLPYEGAINWKEYCVWLDYKDIRYAGEAVADFHHGMSDKRFVELQHECRRIYKEWVSPEGFFSKIQSVLE